MKKNYNFSRPFSNKLSCNSAVYEAVISKLQSEIAGTGKIKRWHSRYTQHLRLIFLNLINCCAYDRELYVGYSRMKNTYSDLPEKSGVIDLRYESMKKLIDVLWHDLKYVEGIKGFHDRGGLGRSRSARMRATDKLVELLERLEPNALKIADDHIDEHFEDDIIVLKDAKKKVIHDYPETPQIISMRQNLVKINQLINRHFIGLCVRDAELPTIKFEMKNKESGEMENVAKILNFKRTWLYRSFNNSSFEEGGRFYGGWWQEIPSKYRNDIRIDGVGVEEIDYSGIHVNLLYAEEELDLPTDDVYTIEGMPPESRDVTKKALQIMLNSARAYNALETIMREFPYKKAPELFDLITHQEIVDAFTRKHEKVSKYFYTRCGSRFQYLDSQIAEAVMLKLCENDIPVLPIHDSFIVPRMFKGELKQAMADATLEKYNQVFKFKKDRSAFEAHYDILIENISFRDVPKSPEEYEDGWTSPECKDYLARLKKWKKSKA